MQQTTQTTVVFHDVNTYRQALVYFEKHGYKNLHNLKPTDVFAPFAIAVDDGRKEFFKVNVTCLAGLASKGIKPVDFQTYLKNIAEKW